MARGIRNALAYYSPRHHSRSVGCNMGSTDKKTVDNQPEQKHITYYELIEQLHNQNGLFEREFITTNLNRQDQRAEY